MNSKFGMNTGSTIRRNEINLLRSCNNLYEIRKEVNKKDCNDFNDCLVFNSCGLRYSLNKMKRWELLDSLPSKGKHNIYFQNKKFLEQSGDDTYFKTHNKVNVKLIIRLQKPLLEGECFKYYDFRAVNGNVSECFWQKKSRDRLNITSLQDWVHKTQLQSGDDLIMKKKERMKDDRNGKTEAAEIDITYTVYSPNPPSAYPFKSTKYRSYLKNNRRKRRLRLCMNDFEDDVDEGYRDESDYIDYEDEEDDTISKVYDDNDGVEDDNDGEDVRNKEMLYIDGIASEEWVFVTADHSNNDQEAETSTQLRHEDQTRGSFCLLDYVTTKKTQHKKKDRKSTQNSIDHKLFGDC